MRDTLKLFKKVDGFKVLDEWKNGHVLFYGLSTSLFLGYDKKSLEILRLAVNNKIVKILRKKYSKFINTWAKTDHSRKPNQIDYSNKVWICWWQGIENAPSIVKACVSSVKENITDREIIIITAENYMDYVKFPEFIEKKRQKGNITMTHLSDLLRLELLTKYGGTWIDATVFCSGRVPTYMLDSELFLFQDLKPGVDGHPTVISSWFISAKANNKILLLTLSLLYEYWKENDKMIDYYLLHDFFQLSIEKYQKDWDNVVPVSNSTPHILLLRLFDRYNEETWKIIKDQTPVHKLSYKFTNEQEHKKNTYFQNVIKERKQDI